MHLGVCYYPEHWPESCWEKDAEAMVALGLRYVRIGEFAWSRLEPRQGVYEWAWLDRAVSILADAGLKIILGTPTATPPKWLVDTYPEILPWDAQGRVRGFGSRRHTCFSSDVWLEQSLRITEAMARRYGDHPAVVAWQVDNEYGCHDTVRSYAPHCRPAFQNWLKRKYDTVDALNQAWGTVFWSQEYDDFSTVELPVGTVTEANPAHILDYARFSSDQVIAFHRAHEKLLRQHSEGRRITHNMMGFVADFDHHELGTTLDVASWDSYPLGFTERDMNLPRPLITRYARTGHPDVSAFHHDLYRGIGRGNWWVMEQQPGPVNWAPFNPAPVPGMIRLWTWEAFAHGAELVSYFRWRQFPHAQEQMHAGLQLPNGAPASAWKEVAQVAQECTLLPDASTSKAGTTESVALLFDYPSAWVYDIQAQSASFRYMDLVYTFFTTLRRLGLDVDVCGPNADFSDYALVVVPTLPIANRAVESLKRCKGRVVWGPRSGSKTPNLGIPESLPPGPLQANLPLAIEYVDSLGPDLSFQVTWKGKTYASGVWREQINSDLEPAAHFDGGSGAVFENQQWTYLAFWPSVEFLLDYLEATATQAGLNPVRLPEDLRLRRRGPFTFAFNFGNHAVALPVPADTSFHLGTRRVPPHDVAIWEHRGDAPPEEMR